MSPQELTTLQYWSALAQMVSAILSALSVFVAAGVAVWGVNKWRGEFIGKRKFEIAEETLGMFFAVRDAIAFIRCPLSSVDEGSTRQKEDSETPKEAKLRNRAYVVTERYLKRQEVFSRFRILQYRFMATFGKETEFIFSTVDRILNKIFNASSYAHMNQVRLHDYGDSMNLEDRKKLIEQINSDKTVFYAQRGKDEIAQELDKVLSELEKSTNRCFGALLQKR